MKKDWEIKKLKDICEKGSSNVNMKDLGKLEGDFPIYGASGFIQNVNFYHQEKEYIGIIKDGSGIGRTMLLPAKSSVIGTLQYILPKEGNSIHFINYALQSLDLTKYKQGAAIPHIYFRDYGETELVVPPLEEQKRIVKILDEKFAQLETIKTNAQTNLQNAKDLFQAQLAKAFSNTTWEKKAIGAVCSKKENIKWKNENVSTEYQYIDLSAVDRESKNISDTQIITKESAPSRAQQIVKTGDILFGTTRPTLKRFCLLADEYDGQICSTGFCVIRPNQNIISSDWMFYQFYNDEFYKYIEPLQKGANYPAVTDKDIMNYNIFVPPLPEQKRIIKELDTLSEKVRQLQEIYTKQIANCDELKQSYLQKAFEGEL